MAEGVMHGCPVCGSQCQCTPGLADPDDCVHCIDDDDDDPFYDAIEDDDEDDDDPEDDEFY